MSIHVDAEFALAPRLIYLNHAAVAPWPLRTAAAVADFAEENVQYGAAHQQEWDKREQALREQLRELLNAPSGDDIALLKNTSEGLSLIAYGLDWREGDQVVIAEEEFPSNRIVWESLARYGVQVQVAPTQQRVDPEQAILDCINSRTRVVSVSSVSFATGLRLDLARIGQHCRRHGVLFCIDAIQSLGALALDVQTVCADFVVADAHKWLLGPEGIAVFFCAAAQRDRLTLRQFGWRMVADLGNYDRRDWTPAATARRFECGSPNSIGIAALHASLSLLLEVGMNRVSEQVLNRTQFLSEALVKMPGVDVLSRPGERFRSGIISFKPRQGSSEALGLQLRERGVICAVRGGGVRFSPHFYTPLAQIEQAVRLINP